MMKIPFFDLSRQYEGIKSEVEPQVLKVLESCSYIGGEYVQNFEKEISDYLDVKHAIGCSSGTAALILALRACDVKPGDEVITTPFTFFATAEAISCIGAIPVFVDIKQDDYTIDPNKIEEAITDRTKVILPVHIFGSTCDMNYIMDIAKRHNLKVVEDCAQAIGSKNNGRNAGTIGDLGCFSFYPTKNLGGCGDGGMVTTNNDKLNVIVKAMREHGSGQNGARALEFLEGIKTENEVTEKITALYNPYKYYNYLIGYNSRLDAVQACILSIKLKYLDDYNAKRTYIAQQYFEGLTDKIQRPVYSEGNVTCWHQFVVRSDYKEKLCAYLSEHGIGSGTFYPVPLHRQKAFNVNNCKNFNASLPVAEEVSSQSVCLPIFPEMTKKEIQYVINTVNKFYNEEV